MNREERKKKIENFWYYYKWHVIIGIFVVIIAAYTIHDAVTKVNPDISIDCIIDKGIGYSSTDAIVADLETNGGIADNNQDGNIKVAMTLSQTGRDPSSATAEGSMMEVVQLRMAVGEANIIISEPYILELYEEHDIFDDLTAIADEMNIPQERRYMSYDGTKVIAIKLDNNEFMTKQGLVTEDCYLALRVLNLNQQDDEEKIRQFENAKDVAKYIIK